MKYEKPDMDVIDLVQRDIVTLSGEGDITDGTGQGGGWVPNPNSSTWGGQ